MSQQQGFDGGGSPAPDIETLTPDVGGAVSPSGNNINVQGTNGTLPSDSLVTHNFGDPDLGIENRRWLTPYVVDPSATVGERGTYATIQAAITAAAASASTEGTVYIREGSYTEDLTLSPGVNLVAVPLDSRSASSSAVVIDGAHTFSSAGIIHIKGISFTTSVGDTFTVNNAAGTARIYISDSEITNSAAAAFNLSSVGGGAQVVTNFVNATGFTQMAILGENGYLECEGGTLAGGAATDAITIGDTAAFVARNATLSGATSAISIDDAAGVANIRNCTASASGGPVLLYTAAGTITALSCVFDTSTGTDWVSGTGSLTYNDITNLGTAIAIDSNVTETIGDWKPYATEGTSSTALKGTSSFNEDDFTVVDGFVSSSNSMTGTATTVGAVTDTTITFALGATPACYQFRVDTVGFDSSTPLGQSVSEIITVRTDGAAGTIIDIPDFFTNLDASLAPATFFSTVVGNDLVVSVLGSPGVTINWFSKLTYITVQ